MERLWERSREGRKETDRKAEYGKLEGRHERSGWREDGKQRKRKQRLRNGETAAMWNREEKERKKQRPSSEELKWRRTEGS